MKTCNFVQRLGARWLKDNSGSMAMAWGVSIVAIVFAVGSAFDTSQASKAKQLAQSAADNMALTASIAVDRNNQAKFIEGTAYTYAQIGGPSEDFTGTMTGKVQYDVEDGDQKLIARATITGSYSTAFMSIIGVEKINLRAVSDVAYAEAGGTPTSVFFIADNSGSMDDKMTSLENSLKDFMDTLETLDTDGVDDTFRTALYPFSAESSYDGSIEEDGTIPVHTVDPAWGIISDGHITRMIDRSGTNSSGALQDAADDFAGESYIHDTINGEENPLKFAVFMTDGSNNKSTETVPVGDRECWVDTYYSSEPVYLSTRYWFDSYVIHYPAGTCPEDKTVNIYDNHYDQWSLDACTQMKDSDVIVYAIAYDVAADEQEDAEAFLRSCSSGDDYFKSANDATALEEAFAAIGESILTEVIRIKR